MSRVICGCSAVIERIDDGLDELRAGECSICVLNEGRYDRSPHWQEPKVVSTNIERSQLEQFGREYNQKRGKK